MRTGKAEEYAYDFIRKRGGSVRIEEVIDHVLSVKSYGGRTPRKTVNAIIQRSARIRRKNGYCSVS